MGVILLIVFIVLVVALLLFVGLFVYSIKKKSKIGIVFSSIAFFGVLSIFFVNTIDELTISKEDVNNDLKYFNVEIVSDFDIESNAVTGMPERCQMTKIKVSKREILKIINDIKHSNNFKEYKNNEAVYKDTSSLNTSLNDEMLNYKYPEFYSREVYKEIDNIPTRLFLSVVENTNILIYQKIED